jgi:HAE1 family hydrophobic/amphiphilic exporter-1
MNIAALSIRRPTFIMAIIAAMLVVGMVAYSKLGVDQFPNINFPIVVVMTTYQGAGPNEVETQVGKPIEEQMSTIAGLRHLSSINQESISIVVAEFDLGGDIKDLEQQSRAKVSMARAKMPDDVKEPIIMRADPSSMPILIASLSGKMSDRDLRTMAEKKIKLLMEQVDGVARVEIMGGAEREIQVLLDRRKLEERQISVTQISGRIAGSSMNIPIGKVTEGTKDLAFRTMGEYRSLAQIRNVPVSFFDADNPVTVADLGTVVDGVKDPTTYAFYNGEASVMLMAFRQSSANTVQVATGLVKAVKKISDDIGKGPGNPKLSTIVDFAKPIRMNLDDVRLTILEGILLAIVVVYLFLGSARSTFITTIALPNSLLGSFIIMYVMGFTINMITLLALSLAVGLLIDDAIVVRENIWRHMERGDDPKKAAIAGTQEVTMAVVATTLTVIAVFLPIGFLQGMMGQFFKEMGLTIVIAMAISLFDAMTTAPLLSAYMIRKTEKGGPGSVLHDGPRGILGRFGAAVARYPQMAAAATHNFQIILVERYEKVIRWSLRHRGLVVVTALILFIGSLYLSTFIKKEFMAPSDIGTYQVKIETPPGTSLETTLERAKEVEKIIKSHPENKDIAMMVGGSQMGGGSNQATFYVEMTPSRTRKIITSKMKQVVREELLAHEKDYLAKVQDMQMMHMGSEAAFNMSVNGDDLPTILKVANDVKKEFAKIPDLVDLDLDSREGNPELRFVLKPEKLRRLGASSIAVGTELRYLVDGNVPARFREADDEYDIRVFLEKGQRNLSAWYKDVRVPNNNYNLVRLADVAEPVRAVGLTKVTRRDRTRYINVMGNIGLKGTIGSVQADAEKIMKKMKLPEGVTYKFWGTYEYFEEMIRNVTIAMVLAVIFMYMVLASLYESIVMPLLIMTALPLAFIGAFVALALTGQNLTMFSMIGLILLLGLVAKNSILLVDYSMQLMRRGVPRDEALVAAGKVRLRPILMTTIALIAGMLPLAFALTEVGKFRQSMGITVIGGLISSLLLTLVLIPALYGWFDDFRKWSRRKLGRSEAREIDRDDDAPLPVE